MALLPGAVCLGRLVGAVVAGTGDSRIVVGLGSQVRLHTQAAGGGDEQHMAVDSRPEHSLEVLEARLVAVLGQFCLCPSLATGCVRAHPTLYWKKWRLKHGGFARVFGLRAGGFCLQ